MSDGLISIYTEQDAADAFDLQAPVFDELFANDGIIQYKRTRVRAHVLSYLNPGSKMLELNAGTGDDAVYFARLGHTVHATDLSEKMQHLLKEKVSIAGMQHMVTQERCSFNHLDQLAQRGPYDHIFSNFAGLNCSNDVNQVLLMCSALLKPGGMITIVMMPPFCLWETMLLMKGKFRTATRRWLKAGSGVPAKVEGQPFTCWYYRSSAIRLAMKGIFKAVKTEGLCTVVPPSYLQGFDIKHPVLFRHLCKLENKLKTKWPWNAIGDYYILTLQIQ